MSVLNSIFNISNSEVVTKFVSVYIKGFTVPTDIKIISYIRNCVAILLKISVPKLFRFLFVIYMHAINPLNTFKMRLKL